MSFPVGVETVLVRWGRGLLATGDGVTARLRIVPMLGGASKVVWSASGDVLLPIEANRSASDGTDEEIAIPAVDQDGWVDGSGRAFKGWSYKAVVTFKSAEGRTQQESTIFKALSGQSQIDLDLLPSSAPGVPSAGAIAVVTSLAGLTGAVTEEDLAGLGVGGGVPVTVIDEKDAATLESAQEYTREQIEANPGGVSEDVVDQKIETAIDGVPAGVTEEAVNAKITAAVADIPTPDVDLATVEAKVSTAKTEAVGSAETYTDGKISALPSTFKGDSLRNPRRVGDNVKVDVVTVNPATGAETSTEADLGNFRGPGWSAAEMVAAVGTSFHFGETTPASPTAHGKPVLWIDTRAKTSWPVPPPLRNESTLSFVIPDDEGVQYRVSGVDKAPGTYPNSVGTSWNITAHAKAGYVLKTGAITSWTLVLTGVTGFPDLDTMIAADAPTHFVKMVGGSMTDTGSTPIAWAGTGVTPDAWGIYSPAGAKVSSPATATAGIAGGLASWTVEFMVDLVTVTPPGNPGMPLINNGGALSMIVGWNGTITLRTSLAEYNSGVSIDRPAGTMTDKLTHVCITVGGGTLTLYLNGVSVGTGTGYTTSASNTLGTTFMPGPAAVPLGTSGRLAIYRGKALTAARVLQHAQAAGVAS